MIEEDNFPLLLGRGWISEFNLCHFKFKTVHGDEISKSSERLKVWLIEYSDLFIGKVGKIKDETLCQSSRALRINFIKLKNLFTRTNISYIQYRCW